MECHEFISLIEAVFELYILFHINGFEKFHEGQILSLHPDNRALYVCDCLIFAIGFTFSRLDPLEVVVMNSLVAVGIIASSYYGFVWFSEFLG